MNAAENISHIHHRQPVFLNEHTMSLWLNPSISFKRCFKEIMSSKANEGLSFYEVGSIVNSVKYDNEDCILPVKEYEAKLHKNGLGKYFAPVNNKQEAIDKQF